MREVKALDAQGLALHLIVTGGRQFNDRCPIPIKPENIDAWLAGGDLARMQAILDDRERPYYEHKKAA